MNHSYIIQLKIAMRLSLAMLFFTGLCYPILVTLLAQIIFPNKSQGSLIELQGKIVGSELIPQGTNDLAYFLSRPSGSNQATLPAKGSHLNRTSLALKMRILAQQQLLGPKAPADLLTSSASGLDPHISVASANFQLERVVKERGLTGDEAEVLSYLIKDCTEHKEFGFLGQEKVNVLLLNLNLDLIFPKRKD